MDDSGIIADLILERHDRHQPCKEYHRHGNGISLPRDDTAGVRETQQNRKSAAAEPGFRHGGRVFLHHLPEQAVKSIIFVHFCI